MNQNQKTLWEKIQNYSIDDPNAAYPFSKRLRIENEWTAEFTSRVMEEYKKFMFLCKEAGHSVSPSYEVDQVWHLHLLYTQAYWKEFCGEVIGEEIHHGPTRGGKQESEKFEDLYLKTLQSYRLFFGEPPQDIWPAPGEIKEKKRIRKIDAADYWLIPKPEKFLKKQALFSIAFFGFFGLGIPILADSSLMGPAMVYLIAFLGVAGFISFAISQTRRSNKKKQKIQQRLNKARMEQLKAKQKSGVSSTGSSACTADLGFVGIGGIGGDFGGSDGGGSSSDSFGGGDFGGGGAESGCSGGSSCGSSCGGGCGGGCGS